MQNLHSPSIQHVSLHLHVSLPPSPLNPHTTSLVPPHFNPTAHPKAKQSTQTTHKPYQPPQSLPSSMADQHRQQQHQQIQGYQQQHDQEGQQHQSPTDVVKSFLPQNGPSASQVLATITMVPLGATLLFLAGLTLAGTILGLAVSTPLFIIFSPILVPAALAIGLSVAGILTSGAFGITALSSFSWLAHYLSRSRLPEHMGQKVADATEYLGQKGADTTTQFGHKVQEITSNLGQKAQDTTGQMGQKVHDTTDQVGQKTKEVGKAQESQESTRTQDSGRTRTREVKT